MKITLIPAEEKSLKTHTEYVFVRPEVKHTGTGDSTTHSGS